MPDSPVLVDVTNVLKKHLEAPRRYQNVFIWSEIAYTSLGVYATQPTGAISTLAQRSTT